MDMHKRQQLVNYFAEHLGLNVGLAEILVRDLEAEYFAEQLNIPLEQANAIAEDLRNSCG